MLGALVRHAAISFTSKAFQIANSGR